MSATIGRLDHIGIAVPELEPAAARYRDLLGAVAGEPRDLPEHGVRVLFLELGENMLELLAPFGGDSPIGRFLAGHPEGGLHHICYEVADIADAMATLTAEGAQVLGEPRLGARGRPVVFLAPKDFSGVLIELEEKKPDFVPA